MPGGIALLKTVSTLQAQSPGDDGEEKPPAPRPPQTLADHGRSLRQHGRGLEEHGRALLDHGSTSNLLARMRDVRRSPIANMR